MSTKTPKKWETAIAALLTEKSIDAAALKTGVSTRTLKGWLALPEFKELHRAARMEVLERTVGQLLALHEQALEALKENLECENPAAKNRAVELVLTHSRDGLTVLDFDARLTAIEQAQRQAKTQPQGIILPGGANDA